MNNIPHRKSDKSLRTLVGLTALAVACAGHAAEEQKATPEKTERIEITGSRIKRVDVEGASPVFTISKEDLQRSGATTVAEALRGSDLNSFGSWGGGSNNGWGSQATVDLKGLGINRSLILLNGRRMVKSPVVGGGAANLNILPVAAVERVEIMTDGASAVYGTDAIAGVVNIILRDDFDGINISASTSSPEREGGEHQRVSLTAGNTSDKARSIFVYEHDELSTLFMRDRDYTKNRRTTDGFGEDKLQGWTGLASGRSIIRVSDGSYAGVPMVQSAPNRTAANLCGVYNVNGQNGFFERRVEDADYPGEYYCQFDYTRAAAISAGQKRDTVFYSTERELNDKWTASAQSYFARTVTEDVSAPTPSSFVFRNDLPSYTTKEGITVSDVFKGDQGQFRLTPNGNRLAEHTDSVLNILVGLKGTTGDWEWDFSAQHNRYNRFVFGTGYALTSAIESKVGTWDAVNKKFVGWDPRDPYAKLPGGIKANYDKKDEGGLNEFFAGVSRDLFDLAGGAASMYVGASSQKETFLSTVDGLAEAGVISGGNAGAGGNAARSSKAVFAEFVAPVLEDLELNLALRHDDYEDFGTSTNPKVALSWRPTGSQLVRASWGSGFRAPTLLEINRTGQQSFDNVTDYVRCAGIGTDLAKCPATRSVENFVTGNKNLKAETSESANIGYVFSLDNLSLSVDLWTTTIDDTIVELSGTNIVYRQYLLDVAASGTGSQFKAGSGQRIENVLPGARIVRANASDPTSRIINVYRPSLNTGELTQDGLSAQIDYKLPTAIGDFKFHAGLTHINSRTNTLADGSGVTRNYIGDLGWPENRVSASVSYSVSDHEFALYARYIADQADKDADGKVIDSVPASTLWNATWYWNTPWAVRVGAGVRNLTDEDPAFQKDGSSYNGNLYYDHQFGRTFFVEASYTF